MQKKVTLKNVAKKAGVSISTVSYALNNHPSISEETKKRIWKIKEELSYQPNFYARNLRKKSYTSNISTNNLGFIIMDRDLHDPIYLPLIRTFSNEVQKKDYHPVVLSISPKIDEVWKFPFILRERRLDGFLTTGVITKETLALFVSLGIPFVVLGNYNFEQEVSMVRIDTERGTTLAMEHLFSLGHKKIGLISEVFDYDYQKEILKAYMQYYSRKEMKFNKEWIQQSGKIFEGGYKPTEKILSLKDMPTAILVTDFRVACGVVQVLQKHNIEVGKEMSVITFAGSENISFQPQLTKIKIDTELNAKIGVKIILEKIKDPQSPPYTITLQPKLEKGETCGPYQDLRISNSSNKLYSK